MIEKLEHRILVVLRQFDGLCLDVEEEREQLATALATALLDLLAHPTEEGDRCSC